MAGPELLKQLFDDKKIAVIQVFIQSPTTEFTLSDIQERSQISLATCHRIMKFLMEIKVVNMRKVKHLTLYRLAPNEDARYLASLLYERPAPLARFVDLVASIDGISQIIMHGEELEDRANIVIIGQGIERDQINAAVALIREEADFKINHLILDPEQFGMLESMGQFSGAKTVLLDQN